MHFYSIFNQLASWDQNLGRYSRDQSKLTAGRALARVLRAIVKAAFFVLPNSGAVFDKFGAYLDPACEAAWAELIYAKQGAGEGKEAEATAFLSIESTLLRRASVEQCRTREDWNTIIAATADPNHKRLYRDFSRKVQYKVPLTTYFFEQVARSLLFLDLPRQLAHAMDPSFTAHIPQRLGKVAFFIFFGVLSWLSTVIQIAFPLAFAALLFVVPSCY